MYQVRAHVQNAQAGQSLPVLPHGAVEAAAIERKEGQMSNHCYLRGTSFLGLFNTIIGCLFNRVLVKCVDTDTGKVVRRYWDRADRHLPGGESES